MVGQTGDNLSSHGRTHFSLPPQISNFVSINERSTYQYPEGGAVVQNNYISASAQKISPELKMRLNVNVTYTKLLQSLVKRNFP